MGSGQFHLFHHWQQYNKNFLQHQQSSSLPSHSLFHISNMEVIHFQFTLFLFHPTSFPTPKRKRKENLKSSYILLNACHLPHVSAGLFAPHQCSVRSIIDRPMARPAVGQDTVGKFLNPNFLHPHSIFLTPDPPGSSQDPSVRIPQDPLQIWEPSPLAC